MQSDPKQTLVRRLAEVRNLEVSRVDPGLRGEDADPPGVSLRVEDSPVPGDGEHCRVLETGDDRRRFGGRCGARGPERPDKEDDQQQAEQRTPQASPALRTRPHDWGACSLEPLRIHYASPSAGGGTNSHGMGVTGLEPVTSALSRRRSPN